MRRLVVVVALALGLCCSLAACDLPGHKTDNNLQRVGNGFDK